MSRLHARMVRLERGRQSASLRDALAHCGVPVPTEADEGAVLAAVDDATLGRVVAYLNRGVPLADLERQRAWLASLSDEELTQVIAGGRR